MTMQQQLDQFYQFATERVSSAERFDSLDELYLVWRAKNPTGQELTDSVAAVKAALIDLENGDTGLPARQALKDLCDEFGVVLVE
jgi:hypothetical protein